MVLCRPSINLSLLLIDFFPDITELRIAPPFGSMHGYHFRWGVSVGQFYRLSENACTLGLARRLRFGQTVLPRKSGQVTILLVQCLLMGQEVRECSILYGAIWFLRECTGLLSPYAHTPLQLRSVNIISTRVRRVHDRTIWRNSLRGRLWGWGWTTVGGLLAERAWSPGFHHRVCTWEVEGGGDSCRPLLRRKSEASLGYMRPCHKKKGKMGKKEGRREEGKKEGREKETELSRKPGVGHMPRIPVLRKTGLHSRLPQ